MGPVLIRLVFVALFSQTDMSLFQSMDIEQILPAEEGPKQPSKQEMKVGIFQRPQDFNRIILF